VKLEIASLSRPKNHQKTAAAPDAENGHRLCIFRIFQKKSARQMMRADF